MDSSISSKSDINSQSPYSVVSAKMLSDTEYPLEYLIPGILVRGQPAVIGGGKKSLKTNMLIDLTLSLASGSKFLNEFHVFREYRTCLMSGESGESTIKETAERIAQSKSWRNLRDYDKAMFSFGAACLEAFSRQKALQNPSTHVSAKVTARSYSAAVIAPLMFASNRSRRSAFHRLGRRLRHQEALESQLRVHRTHIFHPKLRWPRRAVAPHPNP